MAGERPFESPGAGSTHASRRWRAMPRWARWSVRAPLLSEQIRLAVLAMVVGALTGWGAVGLPAAARSHHRVRAGSLAATLAGLGLPGLPLLPMLGGLVARPMHLQ